MKSKQKKNKKKKEKSALKKCKKQANSNKIPKPNLIFKTCNL